MNLSRNICKLLISRSMLVRTTRARVYVPALILTLNAVGEAISFPSKNSAEMERLRAPRADADVVGASRALAVRAFASPPHVRGRYALSSVGEAISFTRICRNGASARSSRGRGCSRCEQRTRGSRLRACASPPRTSGEDSHPAL